MWAAQNGPPEMSAWDGLPHLQTLMSEFAVSPGFPSQVDIFFSHASRGTKNRPELYAAQARRLSMLLLDRQSGRGKDILRGPMLELLHVLTERPKLSAFWPLEDTYCNVTFVQHIYWTWRRAAFLCCVFRLQRSTGPFKLWAEVWEASRCYYLCLKLNF